MDDGVGACRNEQIRIALVEVHRSNSWKATVEVAARGERDIELTGGALYVYLEGGDAMGLNLPSNEEASRTAVGETSHMLLEQPRHLHVAERASEGWREFKVSYWYFDEKPIRYGFSCSLIDDGLPESRLRS